MTDTPNPAILSASHRVAEAEVSAQTATASHREIETEVGTIRSRVAEFEAKRREIGTRRAQGDQRDSDGADLALISADAEALTEILQRRDADAAAARAAAEVAVRSLQNARENLRVVEDRVVEDALRIRAE